MYVGCFGKEILETPLVSVIAQVADIETVGWPRITTSTCNGVCVCERERVRVSTCVCVCEREIVHVCI